jgi:hypothetical protein
MLFAATTDELKTRRACIASAMRAYYTMRIISAGDKANMSYLSMLNAVWSYIECTLCITVACTLSIPKLYQVKGKKLRALLPGRQQSSPSPQQRWNTIFEQNKRSSVGIT